jgi:penicillin-binding protein 1B
VPVKVQSEKLDLWKARFSRWLQILQTLLRRRDVQIGLAVIGLCFLIFLGTLVYYYNKYARIVDERIRRPIFNDPAQIYSAGQQIQPGDKWTAGAITTYLRDAGYVLKGNESPVGTYVQKPGSVEIVSGNASFHPGLDVTIKLKDGQVASITGVKGEDVPTYELEPQLLTGLFDAKERSKRRLLTYNDLPAVVINAIVSVEDRKFFEHNGINYGRLIEGFLTPLLRHHRMQGGSTLTMQIARSFFLSNKRTAGRKLTEMLIATILEKRFTKEQILGIYVNQFDLGQHGSFTIRGFGEAAQVYFGKDIRNVNLQEAALLAGVVNGPSYFSPFSHPDRALKRRNIVLQSMYDNHTINKEDLEKAKASPLKLAPPGVEAKDAPFYVDLVRDRLLTEYDETDLDTRGMRVYTALDPQLQQAALDAVAIGMKQVDQLIIRRRTHKIRQGKGKNATVTTEVTPGPMPQVALIALDPHSGEVLALCGGRDYSASQYNHIRSNRPTGSIFKPFVYASAIGTALNGDPAKAITQTTMLDTTEEIMGVENGKPYIPHNFDSKDTGEPVTARYALAHSINTATIRLAQQVGFDKVVQLAQASGISNVKPTPSMPIGSYGATPLQMAEAYTVLANGGIRMSPVFVRSVRHLNVGEMEKPETAASATVLDPRVASVMTDMLRAVVDGGTASSVRARFNAPAAGKTGTSHDAWFAGYTSNLLCLVWVGNDDYTDIKMEGGKAAAPIWAEFMARAKKLPRYSDMKEFPAPQGVVSVKLDKNTNLPADESCPDDYQAYFIDGTVPAATCGNPDGPSRNIFQKMFGVGVQRELVLPPITQAPAGTNPAPGNPAATPGQPNAGAPTQPTEAPVPEVKQKKRGFWKRLFGGKKDKNRDEDSTDTTDTNQPQ